MIGDRGSRRRLECPTAAQALAWDVSVGGCSNLVRALDALHAFVAWLCAARVERLHPGGWHICARSKLHMDVISLLCGPTALVRMVALRIGDAAARALGGTVEPVEVPD